ncbi:MAG TPA: flagellar biosynthetic protein FliO [Methylomusa anaerophila]|uniref:Flagellar protein n=1 Tax=Methylomusa anaerophila TaxID=1930071 RepID=A0A348AQ25_9FIRM|nr:flagellar biosynthetic protein FliO [Methylomusa anaerophila]BBB93173.1 flagellar biosynthesis protein FliO [Methylomusa anaerophila]HML86995.1 flagellar biosynthetic protein FliO [Methylomusa anaerophila]
MNITHLFGNMLVWMLPFLVLTGQVFADDQSNHYLNYQAPQSTTISWFNTSAYVGSLFLTFLLVVGLAYLTSRLLANKLGTGFGTGESKIYASLSMGPNRGIYVVEIAGKYLILGVTDHSITLLKEITAVEEIEQLKTNHVSHLPSGEFSTMFHRHLASLQQMSNKFPSVFGSYLYPENKRGNENEREKR